MLHKSQEAAPARLGSRLDVGRLHRLAAPSCPAQLPLSHSLQMKRGISSSWHTLALEQALNTALLAQLPHLKHEVSSERNKGHAQSHRASQRHQKAQSQDSPLHAASAPKGGNVALRTGLQHTHTHTHTHTPDAESGEGPVDADLLHPGFTPAAGAPTSAFR